MSLDPYLRNIALRTTDLHDHFSGKRVFIAGSTGFYGLWLMAYFRYLRETHGIDVEVQGGSRSTGWDILDESTYTSFQRQADYVINAAGSSTAATDSELRVQSEGAALLFSSLKPDVCRFLQISTGAIAANTPYSIAKRRAEMSLAGRGYQVQVVRPFATVGPCMPLNTHFAIARFIQNANEGVYLPVKLGIVRSFVHIADLIVQMLHVMVHGDGQPYETGSDEGISIENAAKEISHRILVSHANYASNAASEKYVADISRVRSHFNLSLDWDSRAAIRDTWNYYKSNVAQT